MEQWDNLVRDTLSPDALWYATLSRDGASFTGKTEPGKDRASAVRKSLEKLCRRAGITYHSPHKLRRGHAVYAIKRARDPGDRQAIRQNLMHGPRDVTDTYTWLPANDVAKRIASLTYQEQSTSSEGNNNTALANAIADAVAERLLNETGSTLRTGYPPLVGAPGFEPGASTTDVIIPHSHIFGNTVNFTASLKDLFPSNDS